MAGVCAPMMTVRVLLASLLLLPLAACFDSDEDPAQVCHDDGRCWALAESWGAWAQTADLVDIQDGVDAGVLIPSGGGCYEIDGDGAPRSVCVVMLDGVELHGRPVGELELAPSECAGAGPWETFEADVGAGVVNCFGVLGGYAIRVMD